MEKVDAAAFTWPRAVDKTDAATSENSQNAQYTPKQEGAHARFQFLSIEFQVHDFGPLFRHAAWALERRAGFSAARESVNVLAV